MVDIHPDLRPSRPVKTGEEEEALLDAGEHVDVIDKLGYGSERKNNRYETVHIFLSQQQKVKLVSL